LVVRVQTRRDESRPGKVKGLVVIRRVDRAAQVWYTSSNAPTEAPLQKLVQVHAGRHSIEELLQAGKGEVGLSHYEVRSCVGWHHHMTPSLLALQFLVSEKKRLGRKNPRSNGPAVA